jgi:hypothetical protein
MLTQTMDLDPPLQDWLIDCDRLIQSMEVIDEAVKNTRIKWKDVAKTVIEILYESTT